MSALPSGLGGGALPSLVSTLPSQLSSLIPGLPSGLPGISAMAQSLPAAIMSALPSGLGGGALPSLVSTLPSQLSSLIPGLPSGLPGISGLPSGLPGISAMAQSLPAAIMSALPSGLGGGALPSLVSTLPSQLSSLTPGLPRSEERRVGKECRNR